MFHGQPDPLTLTLESVVGDAENDVLRDLEVTESEVWPKQCWSSLEMFYICKNGILVAAVHNSVSGS